MRLRLRLLELEKDLCEACRFSGRDAREGRWEGAFVCVSGSGGGCDGLDDVEASWTPASLWSRSMMPLLLDLAVRDGPVLSLLYLVVMFCPLFGI